MELPAQFLDSLAHSGQAEMMAVRGTAEGSFKAASVILDLHAQAAIIEGQKHSDVAWRSMRDGVLDCLTNEHEEVPLTFGAKGVRHAETLDPYGNPRFRGGDIAGTKYFFDKLNSYRVNYDVIGQSYYPWWQGSLEDFRQNMIFMATHYQRDIIVVEVAYNWKPAEYRQRAAPFPETPEGQMQFLEEVNRVVRSTPNDRGKGVFWWEPAVVGPLRTRGFFDDQGNALPVVTVFDNSSRN